MSMTLILSLARNKKYRNTKMNEQFNVLSLAYDFFKAKKSYAILYSFFTLSYPIGNIVIPYYYGQIIDLISNKKPLTPVLAKTMAYWVVYIAGLKGLSKIDNIIIPEFRSYLYTSIARFVFETYKENYTSFKSGELISKISKIPYLVIEIFYQIRNSYLPLIYMIVFSLIYFFHINVGLGMLVVVAIILFGIIGYFSVKNCMSSCVNSESSSDKSNENLQDILDNILNVYTSGTIDQEIKEFDIQDKHTKTHLRQCMSCSSNYKTIFNMMYLLAFAVISKYVYDLYTKKKITFPQVNSVFIVTIYLLNQLDSTAQYAQDTITYIGSIIDIQNYISSINKVKNGVDSHINEINSGHNELYHGDINHIQGSVEFRDVNVCFDNQCILKDFSYSIPSGTKLALIGSVGMGKSSLLKLILKLSYPQKGQILIDGKNLPYDVIRKYVSYIPQNPILFNRTLYKNIIYGTNKSKEDILNIMKKYHIENIFGKHNLDDDVGKGGSSLSGGQKQIVVLLRAVLRDSSIILLDEPTTALDKESRNMIVKLIFDVFKNKTVIMITHDPEIVPQFKNVLQL